MSKSQAVYNPWTMVVAIALQVATPSYFGLQYINFNKGTKASIPKTPLPSKQTMHKKEKKS